MRIAGGEFAHGNAPFADKHERLGVSGGLDDEMARTKIVLALGADQRWRRQWQDGVGPEGIDGADLAEVGADRGLDQVSALGDRACNLGGRRPRCQRLKRVLDEADEERVPGQTERAPPNGQQIVQELYAALRRECGKQVLHVEGRKFTDGPEQNRLNEVAFDVNLPAARFGARAHGPKHALATLRKRKDRADERDGLLRHDERVFGCHRQLGANVRDQYCHFGTDPKGPRVLENAAGAPRTVVKRHTPLL